MVVFLPSKQVVTVQIRYLAPDALYVDGNGARRKFDSFIE